MNWHRELYRWGCLLLLPMLLAAGPAKDTVFAQEQSVRIISSDGQEMLELVPVLWGPNWQWTGMAGTYQPAGDQSQGTFQGRIGNRPFVYTIQLQQVDRRTLKMDITFTVNQEVDLTHAILAIRPGAALRGEGRATARDDQGPRPMNVPLGRGILSNKLTQLDFRDANNRTISCQFKPSARMGQDGEVRLLLASGHASPASAAHVVMTVRLPDEAEFFLTPQAAAAGGESMEDWFPWQGTDGSGAGNVLDMSRWLDAPAGRQGRITRSQDQLLYNNQPIKLWGINVSFANCAPDHPTAERRAAFYARYGINAIRFHKFADGTGWQGITTRQSYAEYDRDGLERMDYFISQLKSRGIYSMLSANFGKVRIGPADVQKMPAMAHLQANNQGWREASQGDLWFNPELQDLQIAQIINLLKHTNPYTGQTYADDPSIWCIELVNENDIFFYTTLGAMRDNPLTRQRAGEAFFLWLKNKYRTEQALIQAWGPNVIGSFANEQMGDESWQRRIIYPVANPWFLDPAQLTGMMAPRRQRLLDTMQFFYAQQNAFYDRYVAAIRSTGYKGEILSSNWQAGRGAGHYMNLHSDRRIGLIDRHNYFSGPASMLANPGGGMLSSGMQQVADRPFVLSEWVHEFPSDFGVEGPAINAAYGLGLNGWDASFMFENGDEGLYRTELREQFDLMVPQILGIFPAISRQVLRGDVQQSPVIFSRNVNLDALSRGSLNFDDQVSQAYDVKQFDSRTIPMASLAMGRSVVTFTDDLTPTEPVDAARYIIDGMIRAAGGQLAWQPGQSMRDGFITINSPGTQAVVGFAMDKSIVLDDLTLTSRTPFAAIYVSALEPGQTLATDRHLLVTTLARVRNTGMTYVAGRMVDRGHGPMRIEPVKVDLVIKRAGVKAINILDHNGHPTGQTLQPVNGKITLDGAQTHAVYYEVVFQ